MTNIVSSPLTWKQTGLFREYVSCDNYTGSIAIIVEYLNILIVLSTSLYPITIWMNMMSLYWSRTTSDSLPRSTECQTVTILIPDILNKTIKHCCICALN